MALWRPCMRILCAILVSLQLTATVSALKGDSACKYSLCVTATVEDDVATCEPPSFMLMEDAEYYT